VAETTEPEQRGVRVVIADDSAVMLESLAVAMARPGEIEVVGTAGDAAALFVAVRATEPDVVLLDLRLGDTWGFDLVPGLRAHASAPQVIVLSAMADERTRPEAERSGAWCQLAKGCPLDEIRAAVLAAGGWPDGTVRRERSPGS
jgi:DNA-binding NarL/FixJ family response regulator